MKIVNTGDTEKPGVSPNFPTGWVVYILECADRTLYTGITNDLDHRIDQHENGTGAKYTRGRAPFTLL